MKKPYAKLRAKFVEEGYTYQDIAIILGTNEKSICNKINRFTDWKLSEVIAIAEKLSIPKAEVLDYFAI